MVGNCFPQEISDCIIDSLAFDRDALKSCALTRRAWLPRSRHHLHQRVTINSSVHRPLDYYATPAAQFIRELKLVSPPQPFSDRDGVNILHANTWRIIPRFTEITSLTLLYTSWTDKTNRYLEPIARNVKHLELIVTTFGNCDEFFAFVAMFPELQSLVLTSLTIGSAFGRHSLRIDPPPKLSSLRYGAHFLNPTVTRRVADWLSYLPQTTLPRFSLTWRAPSQNGLSSILRALGPRLIRVELPVSPGSDSSFQGNVAPKLQSIRFVATGDLKTDNINAAISMLADITSFDMREVDFLCNGTSLIDLDVWALQPIDELLVSQQFEDVQHVNFRFSGKSCSSAIDKPDAFTELLRRSLRRLDSLHVLSVKFD
ncbi:hypothetical protein BC835DRAFT_1519919 [Cytidiella melzeri]|nr:hypothetical protein BC835DRAFT_1519919 [Cytidiella melzeri]